MSDTANRICAWCGDQSGMMDDAGRKTWTEQHNETCPVKNGTGPAVAPVLGPTIAFGWNPKTGERTKHRIVGSDPDLYCEDLPHGHPWHLCPAPKVTVERQPCPVEQELP